MFNVGPMEMLVLFVVALVLFGPDKLPSLIKDVSRMIKTLRDVAQGAKSQLDELKPQMGALADMNPLGDLDLRSLNPRTAVARMLFENSSTESAARSATPASVARMLFEDTPTAAAAPAAAPAATAQTAAEPVAPATLDFTKVADSAVAVPPDAPVARASYEDDIA